jgi:hypothetical protein
VIQASNGCARCSSAVSTSAAMRSRRAAECTDTATRALVFAAHRGAFEPPGLACEVLACGNGVVLGSPGPPGRRSASGPSPSPVAHDPAAVDLLAASMGRHFWPLRAGGSARPA